MVRPSPWITTLLWWRSLCIPGIPWAILSRGFCPLVGSTMANWSWVRDKSKRDSEDLYEQNTKGTVQSSWDTATGASGGRALAHGSRPGTAQKMDMGPSTSRPTTRRRHHRGRVHCVPGGGQERRPLWTNPCLQRLANGTFVWDIRIIGVSWRRVSNWCTEITVLYSFWDEWSISYSG